MARGIPSHCLCLILVLFVTTAHACPFPGALRTLSTTLAKASGADGGVNVTHRMRLQGALDALPRVDGVLSGLPDDATRRDRRAVRTVMAAARDLAAGRGQRVSGSVLAATVLVRDLAADACKTAQGSVSGTASAQTVERGPSRNTGGVDTRPSFASRVTRLSLVITAYLTFLAAVIGVRSALRGPQEPEPDRRETHEASRPARQT